MPKQRGHGEGSIFQRANGQWCASVTTGYRDGKQQKKWLTAKTRAEVAAKLNLTVANMQKGIQPGDDRLTLGAFLDLWIAGKEGTVRPKTFRSYADTIRLHIKPDIGRLVLSRLTPTDVRAMMAARAKAGVRPPTIRYCVRVLRIALNDAVRDGLPRNVAALVKVPRAERHQVIPLTPAEASALLAASTEDRMEGIYAVAVTTGLRQGEILGLMWDDLDLDTGTITVRAQLQRQDGRLQRVPVKTDESNRTLSLPSVATAALKRQRNRQKEARLLAGSQWQETGYVFTSIIGTPIDARNLIRKYHAAQEHAGLPPTRFHELRHSAASILLAMGASLHEVKEILGHSRIATTSDVYGHLLPEARKDAATRMDRAFGTA